VAGLPSPAVLIDSGAPIVEVDHMFRSDEMLSALVMVSVGAKPVLIGRRWFEFRLAGRLGFG
jgi:hypothetical protein